MKREDENEDYNDKMKSDTRLGNEKGKERMK